VRINIPIPSCIKYVYEPFNYTLKKKEPRNSQNPGNQQVRNKGILGMPALEVGRGRKKTGPLASFLHSPGLALAFGLAFAWVSAILEATVQ